MSYLAPWSQRDHFNLLRAFPLALLRSRKRRNGMGAPEDFTSSGACQVRWLRRVFAAIPSACSAVTPKANS
jgi:hypothetical protein